MSYATIYWLHNAEIATDGVRSGRVCDAARIIAREMAADRGRSVIVEDHGTGECYRVTPSGNVWKAPKGWVPVWDQGDDPLDDLRRRADKEIKR